MGRVANKVALVTGAASGIGAASACMLAREGATVVLADLDTAAGDRVLRGIEAAGGIGLRSCHASDCTVGRVSLMRIPL